MCNVYWSGSKSHVVQTIVSKYTQCPQRPIGKLFFCTENSSIFFSVHQTSQYLHTGWATALSHFPVLTTREKAKTRCPTPYIMCA